MKKRSLNEILGKSQTEDLREEENLLDRVLNKRRTGWKDELVFLIADFNAKTTLKDEYRPLETIGEALPYIIDAEAYIEIKEALDCDRQARYEERNQDINDWVREHCRRYCEMLLDKAKADEDIRDFLRMKYKVFLEAVDAEYYFNALQEEYSFDFLKRNLGNSSLELMIRGNVERSKESWDMSVSHSVHMKRCRVLIDTVMDLILRPLTYYYKASGAWTP